MKFRLGFLGAWALLVIGVILAAAVAGAEWQNWRDVERLRKLRTIDRMIAVRLSDGFQKMLESSHGAFITPP